MQRIVIREKGLVGTFFANPSSDSSVIVLGGSSGGLPEKQAEALAQKGFSSLALAYFGVDPLPQTLEQIPLEYFFKAILWIKKNQGAKKVALWGGSRGAELSLILGSFFPKAVDAIAAHVPSSVVYGSFEKSNRPAWTLAGRPVLPSAPFKAPNGLEGSSQKSPIKATPFFLASMGDLAAFERAAIPVENLRCPLLLISAEDDQMWPSPLFAKQIENRLKKHRSSIPYFHIHYKSVGHAPQKGSEGLHPVLNKWFSYGGDPSANEFAAEDWIKQTIRFFKEHI